MDELDRRYRSRLAVLRQRISEMLNRLYDDVDSDDLDASFAAFTPQAALVLQAGQSGAVSLATAYLMALVSLSAGRRPNLGAFTGRDIIGTTTAGASLMAGMAAWPAMVKAQIGRGSDVAQALDYGRYLAERFTDNELTGAVDRHTEAITTKSGQFRGWNRILSTPSCPLCQSDEGFHTFDQPMARHPGCDCSRTYEVAI